MDRQGKARQGKARQGKQGREASGRPAGKAGRGGGMRHEAWGMHAHGFTVYSLQLTVACKYVSR